MKFNSSDLYEKIKQHTLMLDGDKLLQGNMIAHNASYAVRLLDLANVSQPSLSFNETSIILEWKSSDVHICMEIKYDAFVYYEYINNNDEVFDYISINQLPNHIEKIKHNIQENSRKAISLNNKSDLSILNDLSLNIVGIDNRGVLLRNLQFPMILRLWNYNKNYTLSDNENVKSILEHNFDMLSVSVYSDFDFDNYKILTSEVHICK